VRVIAKSTLRSFWEAGHADARDDLESLYSETKKASWTGPSEIKARYRSASFVAGDRVVFNIGGNKYRLVVAIKYPLKIVWIRFVGTDAEYDKINVKEV